MTDRANTPRVTGLFLVLAALFVTLLIVSNVVAVKLIQVWGHPLFAAIVVFPVTYILGDILTEVYGFRFARRVIWLGFMCNSLAVLGFWLGGLLPPAAFWQGQEAYQTILGSTPRILAASFAAYLVGEFTNSIVLSRLKIVTRGRWLWMRTIGSTIVGEGVDSVVFATGALAGTLPNHVLLDVLLTQWIAKVLYEAAATPLTYAVVAWVKRHEGIDTYDRQVSFNPLAFLR